MANNLSTERTLRRFYEKLNKGDFEAALENFTADFVYEDACLNKIWCGKEAFMPFMQAAMTALACTFTIESIVATDSGFGISWRWDGRYIGNIAELGIEPTGAAFSLRGGSVGKMENEKIKHNIDYWDIHTLRSQLEQVSQ